MYYNDFANYLDKYYLKAYHIVNNYIIFKESSLIKYLETNGYLNEDEQKDYRVLIKYNDEYYILKKCWKHIIYNKSKEEANKIINTINNL